MPRTNDIRQDHGALQERIGYWFRDPSLLGIALTHRSFGTPHNERFEFLGDGVLNCAIADILFRLFRDLDEGDLSRLRANLVRQSSLHQLARDVSLSNFLLLGEGERKSGGHARASILSDAMEAVVAAVYLDGGYTAALELISRLYHPVIEGLDPEATIKDAKTRLQELLQAKRISLPVYAVAQTTGEQHNQEFHVTCAIPHLSITTRAVGRSRRLAEQSAAELALLRIGVRE